MALTELQQTLENGAHKPAQPSLKVTVSAETSDSPEQVLAAARDLSAHRAKIWPHVEAKRLDVHERGNRWAEVTEGTMVLGVFWERCRCDWSEPAQVTTTVSESNVFKPGSSWQPQAAPLSGGGSVVETTVVRDYRNGFKGTFPGPSTTSAAGGCSAGSCAARSQRSRKRSKPTRRSTRRRQRDERLGPDIRRRLRPPHVRA
jgi:hypothetical protein